MQGGGTGGACRFVQVAAYPPLVVSREACRWRLESDMVLLEELLIDNPVA